MIQQNSNRKINFVLSNLLIFASLFLLSTVIYLASSAEFSDALFFLLSLVFGGLSLAFAISFLSLMFLKFLRK